MNISGRLSALSSLDQIDRLTGGKFGTFDIPCPECGPVPGRTVVSQQRRVLRIWRVAPTFATYRCARCEARGYLVERGGSPIDPTTLVSARAEALRFGEADREERRKKARRLWCARSSLAGTIGEKYLRQARRYGGPLPTTIGFLPGRDRHSPTMISAVGLPSDKTGEVPQANIRAVHLTRLARDGCCKAGTENDKIMIGTPKGTPIVLAPINDGLGLAITEGIEDGLSIFEATGLGVWAAGSASLLPPLAELVPGYVETVSIVADSDEVGQRCAQALAKNLDMRKIRNSVIVWRGQKLERNI